MPCPPLWSPTSSWLTSNSSIYISLPEGFLWGWDCLWIRQDISARELTIPQEYSPPTHNVALKLVSTPFPQVEWSFSCPQHRWLDTCMVGWFPLLPYLTLGFYTSQINYLYLNSPQGLPLGEPKLRQGQRCMRTEDEVRVKDTPEALGVWRGWQSLKPGTLGQENSWVGVEGYSELC